MNTPTYSCDHIGIITKNAESLCKFYKRILNFIPVSNERLKSDIVKIIFNINSSCCFYKLKAGGFIIEIFEPHSNYKPAKRKITSGIHHFGLVVEDKEKFIQYLRQRRVKILTIKRNSKKVYFIEDPDGNKIEIREAK